MQILYPFLLMKWEIKEMSALPNFCLDLIDDIFLVCTLFTTVSSIMLFEASLGLIILSISMSLLPHSF